MTRLFAAATVFALSLNTAAQATPQTYEIDPDHAVIAFWVDHIGYAKVLGQFTETSGSFVFDDTAMAVSDVQVEVKAASVFSNHEARDGHIRAEDFLWAEEHPAITFTADGAEQTGERTGRVTGDLTIRGVTQPVTLDVTWNKTAPYPFGHKRETMGLSARGTVKRSAFGMTYALGGLVGDEVDILIEIEAIAQE